MDFWLGQGTKAAAIPAAVLPRLSNAGQAKKTRNPAGESRKGRLAALLAQLQPAEGMLLRERLAIRPFLLSRGFSKFVSQVLSPQAATIGSRIFSATDFNAEQIAPAMVMGHSSTPAVSPGIRRMALLICVCVVFAIASGKADGHWVSGYYPGWDQDMVPPGKLPLAAITHLLHFSASICSDGSLDLTEHRLTDSHINATVQAVHASGKMVEIVLGGANSGSGFHSATLDANRARFISNIITLVTKHGYDGVDLDWEPLSKDDNQQYQTFVEELRAALKKQRAGLLLTAATAPDPFGNPEIGTLFARLQDKYDQINLMTYVLSGAWPGWISWHGSPLHNGGLKFSSGRSLPSIEECVAEFISAGVAPGKLGIGLAFHGDVWSGGTGTPTGGVTAPLQEWKTPPKVRSDVYFSEIMRRFYSADHERRDERAETPYLSIDNPGSAQDTFVSYCDPAAITARLKFLREKGVGGCIIWHLGQDLLPSGDQPLARAVEEFLNRKSEQ